MAERLREGIAVYGQEEPQLVDLILCGPWCKLGYGYVDHGVS